MEKNVFLIITGVGKQNAKKAVAKLKKLNNNKHDIWVNIGVAGHKTFKIGSIYEVKKVISSNNQNTFFTNSFYNEVPTSTICCVGKEEKKYNNNYLYDMESYGLLEALDSLTIKENIFMFKIISDNLKSNAFKLAKKYKVYPLSIEPNKDRLFCLGENGWNYLKTDNLGFRNSREIKKNEKFAYLFGDSFV